MRVSKRVGRAAVAVGILVVLALAFVLFSEAVMPFTDRLSQDAVAGDGEHTVSFFQDEEVDKVASVYVRHEQSGDYLYRIMVEVWHEGKTVLDSLSLKFNAVRPASALWLETPEGYPWPPLELGQGRNGVTGGVVLNIRDLEFQGRGTVTLVFYLRTDLLIPAPPEELMLDVAFSMHRDGLPKLTKQEGETTILLELARRPTAAFAVEELFSDPGQYTGTDILLEGFYFDGWETTVMSERLEPTGFAEGHLWPGGRMVWIENNLMPTNVYEQLYQQEMIGPLERYGKLRIRGRFEYGGRYGHAGGFNAQIVLSEVELLPWSPATLKPDPSLTSLKYGLIEHFGGVLVAEPVVVPREVGLDQAGSAMSTIRQHEEEYQAILDQLGLERPAQLTEDQQLQVFEEKNKLNAVRLEPTENGYSFELTVIEDGEPFEITGVVDQTGRITAQTK